MRLHSLAPRLAAVFLAAAFLPAHAGLFDDEEARKAIIDLRNRVTATEDADKARAAELQAANAQLAEQLNALRRSLLDLNNQLESVRGEIAKLRGNEEEIARNLAEVQRRQADIGQAMDERLRKLEPMKVTIDGHDATVSPEEKRRYDEAIAAIRGGDFDHSAAMLQNFLSRYPASAYADSARFWLGNAQYGRRDYKEAIASFRAFVNGAPENPHAPEALLALANTQAEMKDTRGARRTIEELMKAYPDSDAARAGKERLGSIR